MSKSVSTLSLPLVLVMVVTIAGGQLAACASGNAADKSEQFASSDSSLKDGNKVDGDSLTRCTEPRPQMCTQEYRPVCAQVQDGSSRTYASDCAACADPDVVDHVDSACE